MNRVSSYDQDAIRPKVGSRWVWEIDKPHARCLLEVTEVKWNGEEWWVTTTCLLSPNPALGGYPGQEGEALNDLSRFWEAVTPVGWGEDFAGGSKKKRKRLHPNERPSDPDP